MKHIVGLCWIFGVWAISCKPASKEGTQEKAPGKDNVEVLSEDQTPEKPPADSTMVLGKKVYDSYCLACHQSDGNGVPGMYPPLNDTTWLADKEKLIDLVLDGLSGKIAVSGETYNQVMPTHNFLKDKEIAAVLTYVRKTFGNNGKAISAGEVAKRRGE